MSNVRRARELLARVNGISLSRALLALGTLTTLILTNPRDLFLDYGDAALGERCVGVSQFAAFCVSSDLFSSSVPAIVLGIVVALAAIGGWIPRWICVPHAYIAWSVSQNAALVEGGDQVNAILSILLVPIILTAGPGNSWKTPYNTAINHNAFAHAAALLIRLQVSVIYAVAAVGKLAVPQWADGTALWYWLQIPTFGLAPEQFRLMAPLLEQPVVMITLTYGVLVLEGALAAAAWTRQPWARVVVSAGIIFHLGIAVILGLWSFGMAMIAALLLCAFIQALPALPTRSTNATTKTDDDSEIDEPADQQIEQ